MGRDYRDGQIGVSCALVASHVVVTWKQAERAGRDPLSENTQAATAPETLRAANTILANAGKVQSTFRDSLNTKYLGLDEVAPYIDHLNGGQPATIEDAAIARLLGHGSGGTRFVKWESYDVFLFDVCKRLNRRATGTYYYIVNTASSNSAGSHWVAVFLRIKAPETDQPQVAHAIAM